MSYKTVGYLPMLYCMSAETVLPRRTLAPWWKRSSKSGIARGWIGPRMDGGNT